MSRDRFDARTLIMTLAPLIVVFFIISVIFPIMERSKFEGDVDPDLMQTIEGSYVLEQTGETGTQPVEGSWELDIDGDRYFKCLDEEGDKGFEGDIVKLDDNQISVKLDGDKYKGMPDGWRPANRNYVVLDIAINGDRLELTCREQTLVFMK